MFFESNPWNPVFQLRKRLGRVLPFLRRGDERALHNRIQLYELISELGFVSIGATCYDFLYAPIPSLVAAGHAAALPGDGKHAGDPDAGRDDPPPRSEAPTRSAKAVGADDRAPRHCTGRISVVVPCYNEEMNLGPLVEGLLKHYDEYIHEIILVDDNSKDNSREIMRQLSMYDPRVRPHFSQAA